MNDTLWKIEVYENGSWRTYGSPSNNFARLYKMCEKFAENGTKARVVKEATPPCSKYYVIDEFVAEAKEG